MSEKPRQYYKTSKKYRDHEVQLAVINAFAADPELKYWLGVAGASGMTALLSYFESKSQTATADEISPWDRGINFYESILGAGSPLLSASGVFDFNEDNRGGFAGSVFRFATGSFAAWNMTCLILRNASGGQEGKGLLGGLVGIV